MPQTQGRTLMLAVAREEGHGVGRAVCAHAAQRGLCIPLDALEAHLEPVWAHTVPERGQAGGIQGREDRAYPQRPYALSTEMWALWLGKRAGPQARERERLEPPLPASVVGWRHSRRSTGPCVTWIASRTVTRSRMVHAPRSDAPR